MKKLILISLMSFLMYGCVILPSTYSPNDIMRRIESKDGKWLLMRGQVALNTQDAIGIKVISRNTLILLKGKYYLFQDPAGSIVISKDSVGQEIEKSVILEPSIIDNYPVGRTLVDSKNKTYYLYGYFFNLDKIFSENIRCNFIFIDGCGNTALLFNRQAEGRILLNSSLAKELLSFKLVYECSSYALLKEYMENASINKTNAPITKLNTTK